MGSILAATERNQHRNSYLTSLRSEGRIPAVVYGRNKESTAIAVSNLELLKTIKEVGRNGIISLDLEGNRQEVMLTDYQFDPIKNEILHADFLYIDMASDLNAEVRVLLAGTPQGVKDGGVLQQALHDLAVTAKPNEIPEAIEVDVTALEVNDTLYVGSLKEGYPNITINHEDDEVVASILAPRQEEEISTGEQQGGGIPENEEGRETEASPGSKAE
ncbi:50S ribosomal protein L25/general stress protein Ctc [Peribacillus deserti]|uniref:Large ribosomal subunit protein bL25 n=1 Tax=Peribacillus deserti TaxID=673318 RepID=A0A2N5M969_9BACI|nr:50S ribosomal protein L25/general stress protein Ctc [Peribacillus deserti]PLT30853.1 50S ribosomal protein L25/general stress protein Ctc [Peribacillus deserti]